MQRAMIMAKDEEMIATGGGGGSKGASGMGDPIDRYNIIHKKSQAIYKSSVRQQRIEKLNNINKGPYFEREAEFNPNF